MGKKSKRGTGPRPGSTAPSASPRAKSARRRRRRRGGRSPDSPPNVTSSLCGRSSRRRPRVCRCLRRAHRAGAEVGRPRRRPRTVAAGRGRPATTSTSRPCYPVRSALSSATARARARASPACRLIRSRPTSPPSSPRPSTGRRTRRPGRGVQGGTTDKSLTDLIEASGALDITVYEDFSRGGTHRGPSSTPECSRCSTVRRRRFCPRPG